MYPAFPHGGTCFSEGQSLGGVGVQVTKGRDTGGDDAGWHGDGGRALPLGEALESPSGTEVGDGSPGMRSGWQSWGRTRCIDYVEEWAV